MDKLTVYQKPTCSTCRATLALLRETKTPFVTVDYFATPLSVATLKNLLKKLGMSPRDILRTGEEIYKNGSILANLRRAAGTRGNNGHAARHGFKHRESKTLDNAREHKRVRPRIHKRKFGII